MKEVNKLNTSVCKDVLSFKPEGKPNSKNRGRFSLSFSWGMLLMLLSVVTLAQAEEHIGPEPTVTGTVYTTIADGLWGDAATWEDGNIPAEDVGQNNKVVVLHRIERDQSYSNYLPAEGSVTVIRDGGELITDQVDMKYAATMYIYYGTLNVALSTSDSFDLTDEGATLLAENACILVGDFFGISHINAQIELYSTSVRVLAGAIVNKGTVLGKDQRLWATGGIIENKKGTWAASSVSHWRAKGDNAKSFDGGIPSGMASSDAEMEQYMATCTWVDNVPLCEVPSDAAFTDGIWVSIADGTWSNTDIWVDQNGDPVSAAPPTSSLNGNRKVVVNHAVEAGEIKMHGNAVLVIQNGAFLNGPSGKAIELKGSSQMIINHASIQFAKILFDGSGTGLCAEGACIHFKDDFKMASKSNHKLYASSISGFPKNNGEYKRGDKFEPKGNIEGWGNVIWAEKVNRDGGAWSNDLFEYARYSESEGTSNNIVNSVGSNNEIRDHIGTICSYDQTLPSEITTSPNEFTLMAGSSSTTAVIDNDLLNGRPIQDGDVIIEPIGDWPAGLTLNSDGTVSVAQGVAAQTFTGLQYRITEAGNPDNSKVENVTVHVLSAGGGDYCITGCNDNTFLNSTDPNTLEYDNVVALYHSSMLKETDGDLLVWGAGAKPDGGHQLTPTAVSPANGYDYQGEILKFTGGSGSGSNGQFTILTTEGLYVWGRETYLVHPNVKSGTNFEKIDPLSTQGVSGTNNFGLPMGVAPEDVKMLYGTYHSLVVVTCTGETWILTQNRRLYGDGVTSTSSSHKYKWHRVSTASNTPLNNIVAVRGTTTAMMALTSDGNIYTWGENVYRGNTISKISTQTYAIEMFKPTGTIKQIGMTGENSYYVLNTNGVLYSLGNNSDRELGVFSTTEQKDWVRVQQDASGTPLPEIAWISPNEHSASNSSGRAAYAAVNALTTNGKLWSWGRNDGNMLGNGSSRMDPTLMIGGLDPNDRITAVATGGHTTMVIRSCSYKYGYLGHRTRGSMGDGSGSDGFETDFNFEDTADVSLCGAPTAPTAQDVLTMCEGFTADLFDAILENAPLGMELKWYENSNRTTEVSDPTSVGTGTYYAFYIPTDSSANCSAPAGVEVLVKYLEPGDPGFEDCAPTMHAVNDINQTPQDTPVSGDVLTNDEGEGLTVASAAYLDDNGDSQPLTLGTATEVYDAGGALAGEMTLNDDGTYTFVPATGYTGDVPVSYTAVDENGFTSDASLKIKVIPVIDPNENSNPIAIDDTGFTKEGVTLESDVLANDSDPEGNPLTVTELEQGGTTIPVGTATPVAGVDQDGNPVTNAGSLTLNADGTYTFEPEAGFIGTIDPITYTISDGKGGTDSADLFITVQPDNGNTTFANDDANSAPKGEEMTGNVLDNDFDPEGDTQAVTTITIDGVDHPVPTDGTDLVVEITGKGEITIKNDGTYTFVPEPDFVGTVPIGMTVCDDGTPVACDNATLYLTSLDAPAMNAVNDINQTPQDTPVSGDVLTNDEGEGLTVASATYLGDNGDSQPLTLGTATQVYDADRVLAGEMTLNTDGTYTFVPASGYTGDVPVSYTAKDKNGFTSDASLKIKVIPVIDPNENSNPIAIDDTGFTKEGITLESDVLANDSDPEGDPLEVTGATQGGTTIPVGTATPVAGVDQDGNPVTNAGNLTLNADGTYTFVPATGFIGTIDPITYSISDGKGGTDSADLFITVQPDNGNTTFANDDANTAPKGEEMTGNVLDNDFDPEGDTQAVTTITIDGTDYPVPADGTDLVVEITGKGVITIDKDGDYTFVPEPDFVGTVPVGMTVCDDGTPVACDNATLYLTSLDAPAMNAVNDINQTPQDTPVSGDVLTNDEGEGLTVASATYLDSNGDSQTLPLGTATQVYDAGGILAGEMTLNGDGSYTFVPAEEYIGTLPIEYIAQETGGFSDNANLTIEVIPKITPRKNNPPVALNDTYTVEQGQTATVDILANDNDPDGDTLTVTEVKGLDVNGNDIEVSTDSNAPTTVYDDDNNKAGTAYVDGAGKIVFVPEPEYTGKVPLDYTISDGNGGTDTAEVLITVLPDNNSDSDIYANDDANLGPKGEPMAGDVKENDVWGGTIPKVSEVSVTFGGTTTTLTPGSPETIANVGVITLNEDGTYTFVPEDDFVGTVPVVYTVTNDEGDMDTATLYLTTLDIKKSLLITNPHIYQRMRNAN